MQPARERPHGRRRRLTWLTNVHAVLRNTTDINQRQYAGCRECGQRRKQCERCYFIEWMTVAQDPQAWDDLVYTKVDADDDGDNVVRRRRQEKWEAPEEDWEDPRGGEVAYGGLLWRLGT